MYAIVDIAGQQFKVEKDQKIYVHRLSNKEGEQVHFDKVLLIDNEGKISIGEPVLKNAAVVGKVMEHMKGDKVKVFKKKRRKGYQKLNGHRQFLTQILIEDIQEKAMAKASKPKAESTPAVEDKETVKEKKKDVKVKPKVETKTATKATAKTETKATTKTAAKAPKKSEAPKAEKKTEAKKTTTKATASKKEGAKKKEAPASAAKKKAEDSDTKKESKE